MTNELRGHTAIVGVGETHYFEDGDAPMPPLKGVAMSESDFNRLRGHTAIVGVGEPDYFEDGGRPHAPAKGRRNE